MEVKQVVVEGKKKYPQYCNSPVYSISNDDIKTEETKKKCWHYSPRGAVTWAGVTSLEAG